MDSSTSEIFLSGRAEFQKACILANRSRENFRMLCEFYKSFLDGNLGRRFCIDGHCTTIYMIEVSFDGSEWGATPRMFHTKEEAEKEAEVLKHKYYFISQCRITPRNLKEEGKNE